ncbi:MAG: RHS repeat-associated core domain-containing protein [Bacteroidales bacterium]|nr:RHS repeat-associated core domain-containing protein [Bacteroidales bacterium]
MNYESCIMHCYTFSAKEKDPETGLNYFGSRYYSSDLSVWLSVDPQASKYPSLSPYVYCANNPVKLVDPDGEEVWFPDDPPKKNVLTSVKNTIPKVGAQIEAGLHQLDLKVTGTAENRFCEGNSDGANQRTITKRDVEVGMAIVATMVTAGAAIEAEGAGSAIISTAAAVNDIDDATVNTTGQTFSQRKTENKPIANAVVNATKTVTPATSIGSSTMTIVKNGVKKASACMADVALSTYSFVKSLIHNKKSNVKP